MPLIIISYSYSKKIGSVAIEMMMEKRYAMHARLQGRRNWSGSSLTNAYIISGESRRVSVVPLEP